MLTYLINKYKNIIENTVRKRNRRLTLLRIFGKWNPIALDCNHENGAYDCSLCKKYIENNCNGCPIQISNKKFMRLERCIHIEEEIEFLISLLDKETQEDLENIFIKWCKTGKL